MQFRSTRWRLSAFFFATLLLGTTPVYALNTDHLTAFEKELNATLVKLKSCYAKNPMQLAQLKKTEAQWISYRKAMLQLAFPLKSDKSAMESYGSLGTQQMSDLYASLTQKHTESLQSLFETDSIAGECN